MKRRIITTTVLTLVLLVGLSVLLYPLISDYVNSQNQSRVIAGYNEELAQISEKDYSELLAIAHEYNENLKVKSNRFMLTESDLDEYFKILNFTGRGVIGTLDIDIINVRLPIYLGTAESVLQIGIGHLEGSSLPVGGAGTHSVISGHRGLPSATLLTNADKLIKGDVFILNILNETLVYQIDHIVIVEPDNFEYLGIEPDKEYCTLFTCTPYGINSHRLLIRGYRIFPESIEQVLRNRVTRSDAQRISAAAEYAIAAVPVVLVSLIYISAKSIRLKAAKSKGRKV